MNAAAKNILIAVVLAVLGFGVNAANEYRIASNDKRYVLQSSSERAEVNRLLERKASLEYDLSRTSDPERRGRLKALLEAVERNLKQYKR